MLFIPRTNSIHFSFFYEKLRNTLSHRQNYGRQARRSGQKLLFTTKFLYQILVLLIKNLFFSYLRLNLNKIKAFYTIKTAYFYWQDRYMILKKFLWLIPFCCFAVGYCAALFFFRAETLPTPSVVGSPLATAVKTLSEQGIGVRINARKPSLDVPEGTVLIQSPAAGQSIKTHQTVFLVIAEQPPLPTAPSFLALTREAIEKEAAQQRISITYATVPHAAPTGTCCAQFPAPGQPLSRSSMIVYCAEKKEKLVLWPSFIGKSISEILPWLEALDIRFEITSASSHYSDRKKLLQAPIIEQHPLPGTIINAETNKLPIVLLHLP